MITDFTNLSRKQIVDLLEASGYNESSTDIFETTFVSCINGQIKYKILYEDIDNNLMDGYVYVFINGEGKLVADY
jgi:hypothetical protein